MPASKESDQLVDENRAKYRQGQADKFAWIKAVGADRELSDAAARAAILCAVTKAGGNGHWIGKRQHLAEVCGMTVRKFDRAIAEVVAMNYLSTDPDPEDRRARQYHIISVEERIGLFYSFEREWKWKCQREAERERQEQCEAEKKVHEWLAAEDRARAQWFAAEVRAADKFQRPIFDMLITCGWDEDRAFTTAQQFWCAHQLGRLPAEMVQKLIAAVTTQEFPPPEPWPPMPIAAAAGGNDCVESGNYRGENGNYRVGSDKVVANPDALTSADAPSPCALSLSSRSRLESTSSSRTTERAGGAPSVRSQDNPQTSGSGDALAGHGSAQARSAAPPADVDCDLCDDDGIARSLDGGHQICLLTLAEDDDYEEIMEYPFHCRHSLQENIGAILRIVAHGKLSPNWTGYGAAIDGDEDIDAPETCEEPNMLISDGNSPDFRTTGEIHV